MKCDRCVLSNAVSRRIGLEVFDRTHADVVADERAILLDEPDSGVDVENVELIGKVLNEFLEREKRPSERRRAALIITHSGFILNYVRADRAHVMLDGTIACSGTPDEIFKQIMSVGYEECIRRCRK